VKVNPSAAAVPVVGNYCLRVVSRVGELVEVAVVPELRRVRSPSLDHVDRHGRIRCHPEYFAGLPPV
jgi:hypothetical protein